jgi:hypothetical protein
MSMKGTAVQLVKTSTIISRHVGMEDEVVLGATGIITMEVQVLLPVH